MRRAFSRRLRGYLITGALVLTPLVVTVYVLVSGFSILDRVLGSAVAAVVGRRIPGAGAVLTIGLVVGVGIVATNMVGRRLIGFGERLLARIPVVRSVYLSAKQLVDAFASPNRPGFRRVVLIEYPREGVWSIGFLTNRGIPAVQEKLAQDVSTVFVPTSPNPTSGFVVVVPSEKTRTLDISVESAFKLIVSGGVVSLEADSSKVKSEGLGEEEQTSDTATDSRSTPC